MKVKSVFGELPIGLGSKVLFEMFGFEVWGIVTGFASESCAIVDWGGTELTLHSTEMELCIA